MTGYESKKKAAQDKLKCQCSMTTKLVGSGCQYCNPEYLDDDDDTQVYQDDALTIAYQSGYYDGKKAAQRPWVGLTDEEIQQGYETTGHYQTLRPQDKFAVFALAKAIEAKLKEKNT